MTEIYHEPDMPMPMPMQASPTEATTADGWAAWPTPKSKKRGIKASLLSVSLPKERIPERFNAPDADITFQSSDGVLFRIHRKNLQCTSGAFPVAEFESNKDDIVPMFEGSQVLELLFTFMYPERQPNLKKIGFPQLADLAEAAEKYEVFPAMATCHSHMSAEIENHPLDILLYAAKHGHHDLLDKAAEMVIGQSLEAVVDRMPPAIAIAWVRYYQRWRDVYAKATTRPSSCTCNQWYANCNVVLDRFGGKVESLSNLDDVFHFPTLSNCCAPHIRSWHTNANRACRAVPKFGTLL